MSAPKTYTAYCRRAAERGETPLTREAWKKRRAKNRRAALESMPELLTDEDGDLHWTELTDEDYIDIAEGRP